MTNSTTDKTKKLNLFQFSTRFLLVTAVIGVAGGLLILPVNFAAFSFAKAIPLLYAALAGIYLVAPLFAAALLRVPGAALLTALFGGLLNSALPPYGSRFILTAVMIGVILELPFLLTGYRVWKLWFFILVAEVFGILYGAYTFNAYVGTFESWAQISFIVILLISAGLVAILAYYLAKTVEKTGVVRSLKVRGKNVSAK